MPYPEHLRSKELAQPVVRESDDSMVRERMPGADSQALARSQVAAHEEAALILARLQAPVAPREAAQPFSVEEHSNAALQKIERHLDTLLGIFRRPAGPRPRGFWQEFKGVFQDLIQDPVDGFSEKIARYSSGIQTPFVDWGAARGTLPRS